MLYHNPKTEIQNKRYVLKILIWMYKAGGLMLFRTTGEMQLHTHIRPQGTVSDEAVKKRRLEILEKL